MADTSLSDKKIGLLIWNVSNFWQSKLRIILKKYDLSLNQYLIIETLKLLKLDFQPTSQTKISLYSGIDVSVVSFFPHSHLIGKSWEVYATTPTAAKTPIMATTTSNSTKVNPFFIL